jgi:hypothetical protein
MRITTTLILAVALVSSVAHGAQPYSLRSLEPGHVSLPVTVFVKGRATKARFVGEAEKLWTGYDVAVHHPRIVIGKKQYYVSQGALGVLFRDFSASDSGQTLVWGQSLTRNPRAQWLPSVKPALILSAGGKLQPASDVNTGAMGWIYYNGPDGYLGKGASRGDSIGHSR